MRKLKLWIIILWLLGFSPIPIFADWLTLPTPLPEERLEQSLSISENLESILSPFITEALEEGVKIGVARWEPKYQRARAEAEAWEEAYRLLVVSNENEKRLREEAERVAERNRKIAWIGIPAGIVLAAVGGIIIGNAIN